MTDEILPPLPPPAQDNPHLLWLGAALGVAPGLLTLLIRSSSAVVIFFLASITLWPLVAVTLAIVRRTRRFGLGMLLGMGIGWLVLLAVCGGGLAHI